MFLARYKDPIKRTNHPVVVVGCNMISIRKHSYDYPQDGKERYLCGVGKQPNFKSVKYDMQIPVAGEELECLNFPALDLGAKNPRIIVTGKEIIVVYDADKAKNSVVFLRDAILNDSNYDQKFACDIQNLSEKSREDFIGELCDFFAISSSNVIKQKL